MQKLPTSSLPTENGSGNCLGNSLPISDGAKGGGGKRGRGNRAEILRLRAGMLSDVQGWRGFPCFLGCAATIREPLMPNPPNVRVTEQTRAECEAQPESWLVTTASQEQDRVLCMQWLKIVVGSGWDRLLISGGQNIGTFSPPPLWTIRLTPPSQLCQQYQGTQFSTIRSPPPHRNVRHPIRFHPSKRMHFG